MSLLLSSERPAAAAISFNPLRLVATWFGNVAAARAKRVALTNLLAMDAHRLDDLGINRGDLFAAMQSEPRRATRVLSDARARKSSDWLNP